MAQPLHRHMCMVDDDMMDAISLRPAPLSVTVDLTPVERSLLLQLLVMTDGRVSSQLRAKLVHAPPTVKTKVKPLPSLWARLQRVSRACKFCGTVGPLNPHNLCEGRCPLPPRLRG